MKGRALSEYRLNFYHSVRFTATKPQKATIDALVAADRRSAKGTEERKKGRNASTILTLPQRGKTNRFLCYLTKQKRKGRRDHPRLHGGEREQHRRAAQAHRMILQPRAKTPPASQDATHGRTATWQTTHGRSRHHTAHESPYYKNT